MKKTALIFIILFSIVLFANDVQVIIPDANIQKNSEGNLEILINSNQAISGLQVELDYNPAQITLGKPVLSQANNDFQVSSKIQEGRFIALIFSLSGKQMAIIKNSPVLSIPLKPAPGFKGKADVEIQKVILSDPRGESIKLDKKIGVINVAENLPEVFEVEPNFPNPFNPTTKIKYQIPKARQMTAIVYNLNGQEIRTLANGYKTPGYYQLIWDGKNNNGKMVASGEYIFTLKAGSFSHSMKMVFLK